MHQFFPPSEKPAKFLILFILATIPILFGAVHPIVQGFYTFLLLLGLGSWSIFYPANKQHLSLFKKSYIIPIILLCYLTFLSIPIPLSIVKVISPVRAESITMVNQLAGTDLAFASLSYNGTANFRHTIFLISLFLYFKALLVLLHYRNFLSMVILTLILVGTFEALYGLLQVVMPQMEVLWLPIKNFGAKGTIIYKNQYAFLLNMCWPFAFAEVDRQLQSQKANWFYFRKAHNNILKSFFQFLSFFDRYFWLYSLFSIVMMLAVIFSNSRGGILSMYIVFFLLISFSSHSLRGKFTLLLTFSIFLFTLGSQIGLNALIAKFHTIENSSLFRFGLITSSLPVFMDHWLTGVGLGSYQYLSDIYVHFSRMNILYDHVHNEYVELAIEMGLPATMLFFGYFFYNIFLHTKNILHNKRWCRQKYTSDAAVVNAAFAALSGFFFHGLIDFGWRLPTNSLYCVTLLSLLSFGIRNKNKSR